MVTGPLEWALVEFKGCWKWVLKEQVDRCGQRGFPSSKTAVGLALQTQWRHHSSKWLWKVEARPLDESLTMKLGSSKTGVGVGKSTPSWRFRTLRNIGGSN
jgi:hypothetical protein